MIESVKAAVKRYNMFSGERNVTVALSGGADSVALLLAMLDIADEFGLNISAAHLNHCLRGAESDGDEQFVKELCEKSKVKLFCERADVLGAAKKNGESIELAARKIRYNFLKRVSSGLVATAHTADDNIETVLHNLSRGTGIDGICGIPPVRDNIIRPLIFVTRDEVERYCAEKHTEYRTDSTNLSDDYTRNRIRHGAVPVLKSVNSAAVKNSALLSERLREDADFIKLETEKAFEKCSTLGGLSVSELLLLHPAIMKRCILLLCRRETGMTLEHTHVELIAEMLIGGSVRQSIPCGCFAEVKSGVLRICKGKEKAPLSEYSVEAYPFTANGVTLRLETAEKYKNMSTVHNLLFKCAVDCDKICGTPRLRGRLPGDGIRLSGRGVTKSFKKLFNEYDIPLNQRERLAVLADEKGVIWLSGFGADERAAVDDSTKKVLIIEEDKNGNNE